jgi:hypothetical protein
MTKNQETFVLDATKNTPSILLDPAHNKFEVEGRSLPENAISFYSPVIAWLRSYRENANPETKLSFKIDYFNTPSAKPILDILKVLDEIKDKGSATHVTWYYRHDDDDMREVGEEYSEFIKTPIDLVSY